MGNADPTYDSLSLAEYVAGYLSIMEEVTPLLPSNVRLLRHLTYLRQLMKESFLADWEVVKMAHKQVLLSIEHKRIAWENAPMVLDTKRVALARIQQNALSNRPSQSQLVPNVSTVSCPASNCDEYQNLTCNHATDHDTDGHTRWHCCAFCWRQTGFKHMHAEVNCRKAKEAAKCKQNHGQKRMKHE